MTRFFPLQADDLGLRSALSDRLLPVLVAAMTFLAALALAGTFASAALAEHWRSDTAAALTVQVPEPEGLAAGISRQAAVLAALAAAPGVSAPSLMSDAQVQNLLEPWLGKDSAALGLPLPAIITANWAGPGAPDMLAPELDRIAPGTLVSTGEIWAARVASLTASLQACAAAVLVIVAGIAAAVVAVATRSGLAQRRETIEIVHGLGALDADIAGRFSVRATWLAVQGAVIGTVLALPVLFWLAGLAAPFAGFTPGEAPGGLPAALLAALPALPVSAALIGWGTSQITVRGWLRGLA